MNKPYRETDDDYEIQDGERLAFIAGMLHAAEIVENGWNHSEEVITVNLRDYCKRIASIIRDHSKTENCLIHSRKEAK